MAKPKWTREAIIEYVESQGYKFIEFIEYNLRESKIIIWCGNPEHEPFKIRFDSFLRDGKCKKCHIHKNRKSHEEFEKELFNINPNIELLTEYKRANIKVKCRCKVCGHEWWAYPTNLIRSENPSGCPKCANTLLKTHEQFIKEVALKHPNIEVLSQYINDGSRVDCRCKIDGHEWSPIANTLLCGSGCRICGIRKRADAQRKSHEQFVKEVFEINPNIKILSEYKGQNEKIDCECLIDGCKWSPFAGNLLKNQGCPKCNQPKGEKKLENILINYNIKYETQYSFNDCRCKKPLLFDFYLLDYNILIEYDGEGHYRPVRFGGMSYEKALDRFIIYKIRDTIKNIYCEQNNIKLIRIPYWDYKNIEEILIKELNL